MALHGDGCANFANGSIVCNQSFDQGASNGSALHCVAQSNVSSELCAVASYTAELLSLGTNDGMFTTAAPYASAPSSCQQTYLRNIDTCNDFVFYLNTVVIGTICILGLIGNTLSIIVLRRDRQNKVAIFLLQTLAIADNCVLVLSLIVLSVFVGLSAVRARGVSESLQHAVLYAKLYVNPFGYITQSFTIWSTVLLAINRFIAVCKPFIAETWLTLTRARIQVFVVFTASFALNLPRFFQHSVTYVVLEKNGTNVTEPRMEVIMPPTFMIVYFQALYTALVLILPLLLLIGFNTALVLQMQRSKRSMKRNSLTYAGTQESNITIVMVIIIVEMLLFHTPDRVLLVLKSIAKDKCWSLCPHPLFYAGMIANVLVAINSATNFIIYYVFRPRFRRILKTQVCTFGRKQDAWLNGVDESRKFSCHSESAVVPLTVRSRTQERRTNSCNM